MRKLGRLVDPALEFVLALELAVFGGHEAEHGDFALRQEAERLEAAGAGAVIFEVVNVDIDAIEQQLSDRIVTAFCNPGAGYMKMPRHRCIDVTMSLGAFATLSLRILA